MTQPPDWIEQALALPGSARHADIAGNRLHYREWNGPAGARDLLLVHGFRAHSHWWDAVAPLLAEHFHVLAMDLGGMGDSGHRSRYDEAIFAAEIAGLIDHAGLREPVLIGHSFGGMMGLAAGFLFPGCIARLIMVDTHVTFADNDLRGSHPPPRPPRHFASADALLPHFRLMPEQSGVDPRLLDHVAQHSIRHDDAGWTWKFDTRCAGPSLIPLPVLGPEMLAAVAFPVDFIHGANSAVVPAAFAARIATALRNGRGPIAIPAAHHHVPLDQPLALTAALLALLADSLHRRPVEGADQNGVLS